MNKLRVKKVLLFLANGFEIYEASAFIDVIGWNLVDGDGTTELFTCGITKDVKSTFNQKFTADFSIDEIDADDYEALAIPGGFVEYDFYQDAYDERFMELIRTFHAKDKIIASICVGALPIGKSGILTEKKATTYPHKDGIRQEKLRLFGATVLNQPIVEDGRIITSHGPATAIDVAFLLLERLTSKHQTDFIKTIMGFDDKIVR